MDASFVSKARTAFHSAAVKAEKVFTDIRKSDPINDPAGEDSDRPLAGTSTPDSDKNRIESKAKYSRWKPSPLKTRQDWQERFKNIRIGRRGAEDTEKAENSTMAYAIFDENLYLMSEREFPQVKESESRSVADGSDFGSKDIIPSTTIMKQLAIAVEAGKTHKSMKDLLASPSDSSPVRERAGLSFSAMKSLMLREKDDNLASEFGADKKVVALINSLQDAEGHSLGRRNDFSWDVSLAKDIHGAPPESFIVKLSEAIGSLKSLRKMASFWSIIVAELRRLWSEGQFIPGIPPDDVPDLNSCLLYQHLQVINCCVSRKRRHSVAVESLESVISQTSLRAISSVSEVTVPANPILYAKTSTGENVLRLGADKQSDLTMLETGEPVYTPVMQEGPLLTEDLIRETEEFVLRTGSLGAGCSQLLSDMQAFKAANPGCILEDFVRWHSPPDWTENDTTSEASETSDGNDILSSRGHLSRRMQKEGNLWRELWETAKPIPAVRQSPLFDEDLAVEGILNVLEDISPSELFEQLFISLLGSGFIIAEVTLSRNESLSKLFYECKDYIIATSQSRFWVEKIDDICQVYETVETMLLNPDEVVKLSSQPGETTPAGDLKNHFKRLSFIFGSKDKLQGKAPPKYPKNLEDKKHQLFSSIF